jgi:hypothetical protein
MKGIITSLGENCVDTLYLILIYLNNIKNITDNYCRLERVFREDYKIICGQAAMPLISDPLFKVDYGNKLASEEKNTSDPGWHLVSGGEFGKRNNLLNNLCGQGIGESV